MSDKIGNWDKEELSAKLELEGFSYFFEDYVDIEDFEGTEFYQAILDYRNAAFDLEMLCQAHGLI